MKYIWIVLLCSFLSWHCQSTRNTTVLSSPELDELFALMQGSFSSYEQSARDTAYSHIKLHMTPIWNTKGRWLYVEQAVAKAQDKPYRQRVYEIVQVDKKRFESRVYTLKDEKAAIGAWKTPSIFDKLSPKDLERKDGCSVFLFKDTDGRFKGGTEGNTCSSNLRGATYATFIVTLEKEKLTSWDRGYDAQGKQVWGATKGAYIFKKVYAE